MGDALPVSRFNASILLMSLPFSPFCLSDHSREVGAARVARSLSLRGVVDERWLIVQPVVLGVGMGSFAAPLDLALASGQAFQRGSFALT